MFTPDFYIDSFQSTKRLLTNKVITDPTLNKAAHNYIDAQTTFAKMLTANALDLAKYSVESVSKVLFPKKEEVTEAKVTRAKKATA